MTTGERSCSLWLLALLVCAGSGCGGRTGPVTSAGPGRGDGPNPCHECLDECGMVADGCVVSVFHDVTMCEKTCFETTDGEAFDECLEKECRSPALDDEEECFVLGKKCLEACREYHDEELCNADPILPPGVTEETIAACCTCRQACVETRKRCGDHALQVEDECLQDCEKLESRDEEEISTCHDECSWSRNELLAKCFLISGACLDECRESCGASTCAADRWD